MPNDRYETLRLALNRVRTAILFHGPITLYEAQKKLNAEPSTMKRHLDTLLGEKEIVVYRTEPHKSGQTKKYYGLTFYGFLRAFRIERAVALKNFRRIMELWLPESKFSFFISNNEAQAAIKDRETENSLAKFCQLIANLFGEAEDFLYSLGYDEFDPSQIIQLSMQFAGIAYGKRFAETLRVLCRNVPAFRQQITDYIQWAREALNSMEKSLIATNPSRTIQ
jgi:DNA-binding MarR family transcriptional regulator